MIRPRYQPLSKAALSRFSKLGLKKHRDAEGLFLAEGLRTVRELLDNLPSSEMLVALLVEPDSLDDFMEDECYEGKLFLIDSIQRDRLAQTSSSQGVFGIFRQQRFDPATLSSGNRGKSLLIALDDVQDPGNVGTIIRTGTWFGADAIICGGGTADPYNTKAVRSSAGSVYGIHHYSVPELGVELQRLRQAGHHIICSSLDGEDYRTFDSWPGRKILVIGNEANGISREILDSADRLVRIPHAGERAGVESLNASVSAAVLMAALAFD